MKRFISGILGLALLVGLFLVLRPSNSAQPAAVVRVLDTSGKPIPGARIERQGLRTKPGPYEGGWYGWRTGSNAVPNTPILTDADGYANLPYPKYVFEQIETGTICLGVSHPDFVSERPERKVTTALPAGAPIQVRLKDLWARIRRRAVFARLDPIVLEKGAIVKVTARSGAPTNSNARLFVQVADLRNDTNDWTRLNPTTMIATRLMAGAHTLRAVQIDESRAVWFSDVVPVVAVPGGTNEFTLDLKPGVTLSGQLDESVPRPVTNGRVVVRLSPKGMALKDEPPGWRACAKVNDDGTFSIPHLPAGDLEVVALCQGFVSTNGPGPSQMRYPQQHVLGTDDMQITIGMEPTARLEVTLLDPQGQPVKGGRVVTWPNVQYGGWAATILMSDFSNSTDSLMRAPHDKAKTREPVADFQGISDSSGLAILSNLPDSVTVLAVEHPSLDLPPISDTSGRKNKQAKFTLKAGETNRLTLKLEPRDQTPITHY